MKGVTLEDKNTGRYWQVLAGTGRYWQVLAGNDRYWPVLAGTGRYGQVRAGIVHGTVTYWQVLLLAGTGRYWQVLAGGVPKMYNSRITEVHQNVKFLSFRVTPFMTNNFSPNRVFCVRNGPVMDEEGDLHRQTQVFVLGI
jgi:hypothetical protein